LRVEKAWIVPLVLAVLMLAVVLRQEPPRRAPRTKRIEPVPTFVEAPLPPEPPFAPLKHPNSELPASVDDVLARKCRRCHTLPARNGAPFALYTWLEMQAPHHGEPIYQRLGRAVESGFMPNVAIVANPPVERLTSEEKRTLLDWVAAGAPRASSSGKPPPGASVRRKSVTGARRAAGSAVDGGQ
jgi:hypothetical protein